MPKKDTEGNDFISESGNWNVADQFSKSKIMYPMDKCEIYQDIARYGHESFFDELVNCNSSIPNEVSRIKALNRLIDELIKICENCMFAMSKPGSKKKLFKHQENLEKIKPLVPNIFTKKNNHVAKTSFIIINEGAFNAIFKVVLKIKSEINEPLNQNDLIFVNKEQFNPLAFKDNRKDRMVNKG